MTAASDTPDGAVPAAELPQDDEGWRQRLTPEQFEVTRRAGTERAFTGAYWDTKEPGTYRCVACNRVLFSSGTKFDSGTGWPSFWDPADNDAVTTHVDRSLGMVRTEVCCAHCQAHLGHLFEDGPPPSGLRYCMNSAALCLVPDRATGGDGSGDDGPSGRDTGGTGVG